jgi:hypothetical protein
MILWQKRKAGFTGEMGAVYDAKHPCQPTNDGEDTI